jgi:hypothetical protein
MIINPQSVASPYLDVGLSSKIVVDADHYSFSCRDTTSEATS